VEGLRRPGGLRWGRPRKTALYDVVVDTVMAKLDDELKDASIAEPTK
jgi:hypothetical protein